ncbi:hypothetical protein PybrP1_007124 [[Pythium] brassicae (nom. inval.)]|nr:hypothetical protein PybrP1_007124 [[Pythium] brassicae (nom. inval.)]
MAPSRPKHGKRAAPKPKKATASSRSSSSSSDARSLYTATDRILVLGDGGDTGDGLLATSLDSEAAVRSKYANAAQCLRDFRALRGRVLHGVDATKLHELPARLPDGARVPAQFSRIVFNFPHSGQQRVHVNRALLRDFFESARARLEERGEAHVTLKTRPPYSNWHVEKQAAAAGFVLKERRKFDIALFPGYHHRTTDPLAKAFEPELCVTYVFVVNRSKYPFEGAEEESSGQRHDTAAATSVAYSEADATSSAIAQLLAVHARTKAVHL